MRDDDNRSSHPLLIYGFHFKEEKLMEQTKFSTVEPVSKELIDGYIKNISESVGWNVFEDSNQSISRCFHLLFSSVANFLSKVKQTTKPVSLILEDPYQNFSFGAIVEYHKNEVADDMPGNWSLVFTFDPADLDGSTVYRSSGNEYKECVIDIAEHQYGYSFELVGDQDALDTKRIIMNHIISNAAKTIRQWVDENSMSTEPVITEIKGKVIIEACLDSNGMKVFAISPSGELKNIIKDDAAIEEVKEVEKATKGKKKSDK